MAAVIKVAALCGSLCKASFNRALLRSAMKMSSESIDGMSIEYIDMASLPLINTDLEINGRFPPAVESFRRKILEADGFLFASPEYNYSIARGNFGGGRAQYHLRQVGVYLDLHFINKPELFVRVFQSPPKFDNEGNLVDEVAKEKMKELLLSLQASSIIASIQGNCYKAST